MPTALPPIAAYEEQVQALHAKKIALQEKLNKPAEPVASFDESYRTALAFLANPRELWDSDALDGRRLVPQLLFGDRLPYCRNWGYRTAETTLPIKVLQQISAGEAGLVDLNEESSNRLFAVLTDWNTALRANEQSGLSSFEY